MSLKSLTAYLVFIFVAAFPSVADSKFTEADVEHALNELDADLGRRDIYIQKRVAAIDSIHALRDREPRGSQPWLDSTLEIAQRFRTLNNDSSLVYLTQGLTAAEIAGNRDAVTRYRMARAVAFALGGMVNEALNDHNAIDTTGISPDLMAAYHMASRQMYSYISNNYDGYPEAQEMWINKAAESQNKALPLLDPTTPKYRRNLGEYYFSVHEYAKANEMLTALIASISPDHEDYAIVAHLLAQMAQIRGDRNEYLVRLAQSARSDVRRANFEITSLQDLGGALFEQGRTDRAHNYLTLALDNAVNSRGLVRMSRTTKLFSLVENDHRREIARYRTFTTIAIVVLIVALLLLVYTIYFLRKQLTRVERLKSDLQEASTSKDIYISQFITLCSIYMDRLRDFSKLVNRKISAGQADELLALTNSGKFVEEQSRTYYEAFDGAFLHIYPDFVERVNDLLRPDEAIAPDPNGKLNPALRILAFMRLGIDDAARIAAALNLSVNTVYAYRNRLRNRAISRDTFEADVMAIPGK